MRRSVVCFPPLKSVSTGDAAEVARVSRAAACPSRALKPVAPAARTQHATPSMSLSKPADAAQPADAAKRSKRYDHASIVNQFARLSGLNKDLRQLFEPFLLERMRSLSLQNLRLKTRLFYKDYGSSRLIEALCEFNTNAATAGRYRLCMCEECICLILNPPSTVLEYPRCFLLDKFLRLCEKEGLVVGPDSRGGPFLFPKSYRDFKYDCTVYAAPGCDICFGVLGDWKTIGYGDLITKEAGTSKPRIWALKRLFAALHCKTEYSDDDSYVTDTSSRFEYVDEDPEDSDSDPDEPTQPVPRDSSPELSPAFN